MTASIAPLPTGDPTLAARYLADQLSEEERREFEERMVSDPALVRELEATARFKIGLQSLRDSGELDAVLQKPARRSMPWLGAVAASLVLVGLIGVFVWNRDEPVWMAAAPSMLQVEGGVPLASGRAYRLARLRAVEQDIVIELPREREAIALHVLPDSGDATTRYDARLRLIDAGAAAPVESALQDLQAGSDGFVSIYLDSARLVPGEYELELSTATADGASTSAGSFVIRFSPAPATP